MQPPITAKCQRVPLLPVRDELLLGRYFILNTSCLNWSMRLQEVTFLPICLLPPSLGELPSFCFSAFIGGTRGFLSLYSFSSSLLSLGAELLAKEQSPGNSPSPLCSLQVKRYPRGQESYLTTQPPTLAATCIQGQSSPWQEGTLRLQNVGSFS